MSKIITKTIEITNIARNFGFKKTRGKNGSHYYERTLRDVSGKSGFVKYRFSNHELGEDWTGRQQTGGADVDIVEWADGRLTAEKLELMFQYPGSAQEIFENDLTEQEILDDHAKYVERIAARYGSSEHATKLIRIPRND